MDEFAFGSLSTLEKRVNKLKSWRAGVRHHNRLQPRAPRPGDTPVLTVTVGLDLAIDRVECHVSQPQTAVHPLHLVNTEWDLLNWRYVQTWQAVLPAYPAGTVVRYTINAYPAGSGRSPIPADDGATFSYLVGDPAAPEWSSDAVIYQIFPDRFHPGNGRSWNNTDDLNAIHGGTLRGIIDQLDYIAGMGFNCLWLTPFFPDDDTHHGYHATDYFDVKPGLGTLADVRELVAKAHKRGIRLLLDFVANHWSSEHESFQAAVQDKNSPYYDWYNWIEWPHDYETFFGVMELPQVNVDNPDVRDYLLRSARFWLADVGFDGLRLDYALGPSHDFWTDLRATVKQIKPDAWLFGEVVETPTTILSYEGRLDGCLDFPLMQALRDTFALQRMDLAAFDAFLNNHLRFFPPTFSLPSFLDNHDMNRFLYVAKNDPARLKLAALCQFTLPGAPVVYNGTEVGVSQQMGMAQPGSQGMAEARQRMAWGDAQDADLRAYFQWLIRLRQEHAALRRGARATLHLDAAAQTYVYLRHDEDEKVVVALNLSTEPRTIPLRDEQYGLEHTFHLPPQSGEVKASGG